MSKAIEKYIEEVFNPWLKENEKEFLKLTFFNIGSSISALSHYTKKRDMLELADTLVRLDWFDFKLHAKFLADDEEFYLSLYVINNESPILFVMKKNLNMKYKTFGCGISLKL